MATLGATVVTTGGIDWATGSVPCSAGGDAFTPSMRTFLRIGNGTTGTRTVTVVSALPCGQAGANHNVVFTVASTDSVVVGPFDPRRFAQSNGLCNLTYDAVSGGGILSINVFQVSSDPT